MRYYGQWMRDEAERRIGHLYPPVEVTAEMVRERPDLKQYRGRKLTVIAWLWARTVKSPNPAFADVDVPLVSTFMLVDQAGQGGVCRAGDRGAGVPVRGEGGEAAGCRGGQGGTKLSRGANFRCVMSGAAIVGGYIRSEAQAGRMGSRLMAIVAEGDRGRVYLAPAHSHEAIARSAQPEWKPDLKVTTPCHDVDRLPMYGMPTWGDAFTPRQLVALDNLLRPGGGSNGAGQARMPPSPICPRTAISLDEGGCGTTAYAEAVGGVPSASCWSIC